VKMDQAMTPSEMAAAGIPTIHQDAEDTIPPPSPQTNNVAAAVVDQVHALTALVSTPSGTVANGIPTIHQGVVDTIPTTSLQMMIAALVAPKMLMTLALPPSNAKTEQARTPSVMAANGTPTTQPDVVVTTPTTSPRTISAALVVVAKVMTTVMTTTTITITATTTMTMVTTMEIAQTIGHTLTSTEMIAPITKATLKAAENMTTDTALPLTLAVLAKVILMTSTAKMSQHSLLSS